jgi:hypothetical protein
MMMLPVPGRPPTFESLDLRGEVDYVFKMIDVIRRNVETLAGRGITARNIAYQSVYTTNLAPGGSYQFGLGSAAAPSVASNEETDSGLYWTKTAVGSVGSVNVTIDGILDASFKSGTFSVYDVAGNEDFKVDTAGNSWYTGTGNFGFGTSSPLAKVQVNTNSGPQLRLSASDTSYVDFEYNGANLQIDMEALGGYQIIFTGADDATDYLIQVKNTNTTSNTAGATLQMQVGGISAGDPYLVYDVLGGASWIEGCDNSDSDKYKLTTAALSGFAGTKGFFLTTGIYATFSPAVASSGTAYAVDISGAINTGGTNGLFRVLGAASTGQTASTEIKLVDIDLGATVTWATGALTNERAVFIEAPTLAFAGASTVTNAATVYIDRAPQAGTNATITNPYSLWIAGGKHVRADGTNTVASAAGAIWDAILLDMDVSVTGSTNITTATGFNMVTINAPTVTDAGTMGTITNSATVYIGGAPTGSGLTITNAYTLWVDAGNARFDGSVGIGVVSPDRALEVLDAGNPQLRLTYTDASVYCDFIVNSAGALTLIPTGALVAIEDALRVGTASEASADGDFSAGISGDSRMFYDQSSSTIWVINGSGTTNSVQYNTDASGNLNLTISNGNLKLQGAGTFGASSYGISFFNASTDYKVGFDSAGGTRGYIRYNVDTHSAGSNVWGHIFSGGAAGSQTDWAFIGGGRMSVGNTSPEAPLHVTQATAGSEVFRLDTTATNDDPNYKVFQNRVATTDATVTTLQTIAITASNTYQIEARVQARRTGGTSGTAEDGASYVVRGTYKTVAGTVTLIGAVTADYTAEDQAAWDATLTISGTNVLVRVTGAANNNVTWHSTTIVSHLSS